MKRYSLRFLFVVSTVLIVFVGLSIRRRQEILKQKKTLELLHVTVVMPETFWDKLWQRKPYGAVIQAGGWSPDQLMPKLKQLGVENRWVIASDDKIDLAVNEVRNGKAWSPLQRPINPLPKIGGVTSKVN
jgi:hypothetical protein